MMLTAWLMGIVGLKRTATGSLGTDLWALTIFVRQQLPHDQCNEETACKSRSVEHWSTSAGCAVASMRSAALGSGR
jgi:hypothetical protein